MPPTMKEVLLQIDIMRDSVTPSKYKKPSAGSICRSFRGSEPVGVLPKNLLGDLFEILGGENFSRN
jgi:hypothetical protein